MKNIFFVLGLILTVHILIGQTMKKELTEEEKRVILNKGTERPFTGKYYDFKGKGIYACRQCGTSLYRSEDKFDSNCGWPSFDDEISGAVKRIPDADGKRTEIVCTHCGAHLGHIFKGEGFTSKNTRHCVNSVSMEFVPAVQEVKTAESILRNGIEEQKEQTETAIFAGGCFWGVEYLMQKQPGVLSVTSGYIGGKISDPTYEQVCTKTTGHAEAVKIIFNPLKVNYETLAKLFFEIHDPTQLNGQGPDLGEQYRSEIFYTTPEQQKITKKLIVQLDAKGYKIVTKITPATTFWPAEKYHQDYYDKKGTLPYCHRYTKRF